LASLYKLHLPCIPSKRVPAAFAASAGTSLAAPARTIDTGSANLLLLLLLVVEMVASPILLLLLLLLLLLIPTSPSSAYAPATTASLLFLQLLLPNPAATAA
jgi:hypothetical protein